MEFSELIKTRRKINRLSQKQLADKLNVTDKAISTWEVGKCLPDILNLIELCKVLHIHPYEVLKALDKKFDEDDTNYANAILVYKQKKYIDELKSLLLKNDIEIPKGLDEI